MTHFQARIRGRGSARIAAFGATDAENTLHKELDRAYPGARLEIRQMRYPEGPARVVEEFDIEFKLEVEVGVEAEDEASARRAAFSAARRALQGTRFARVAFDKEVRLVSAT